MNADVNASSLIKCSFLPFDSQRWPFPKFWIVVRQSSDAVVQQKLHQPIRAPQIQVLLDLSISTCIGPTHVPKNLLMQLNQSEKLDGINVSLKFYAVNDDNPGA